MTYTVEIYKRDARKKSGERLFSKTDYDTDNLSMLEHTVKHTYRASQGFRYEIHETMVERVNMMGGAKYMERYDTPRYCSPSSEAYWSM
jgi:hypothetical protein